MILLSTESGKSPCSRNKKTDGGPDLATYCSRLLSRSLAFIETKFLLGVVEGRNFGLPYFPGLIGW